MFEVRRTGYASGQMAQNEPHRDAGSIDSRFSAEDFRVTHVVLFPLEGMHRYYHLDTLEFTRRRRLQVRKQQTFKAQG